MVLIKSYNSRGQISERALPKVLTEDTKDGKVYAGTSYFGDAESITEEDIMMSWGSMDNTFFSKRPEFKKERLAFFDENGQLFGAVYESEDGSLSLAKVLENYNLEDIKNVKVLMKSRIFNEKLEFSETDFRSLAFTNDKKIQTILQNAKNFIVVNGKGEKITLDLEVLREEAIKNGYFTEDGKGNKIADIQKFLQKIVNVKFNKTISNGSKTEKDIPINLSDFEIESGVLKRYVGNSDKVIIPGDVKKIDSNAFCKCENLIEINIPKSVEEIERNAFSPCKRLTKIIVEPANPRYISKDGVLFDKEGLTFRTIDSGIELVCYPANKPETKYEIPKGVKILGSGAFGECENLTEIMIPKSVEDILSYEGEPAFNLCRGLTNITIDDDNPYFRSEDGVLYNKNMTELVCYPVNKPEPKYELPNSVESVAFRCFDRCRNLAEIIVDDSNPYFRGKDGELYDKNMTELVYRPKGKKETKYEIPNGIKEIKIDKGVKDIEEMIIPESVERINAWNLSYCVNLIKITVDESNPYYRSVDGVLYDKNMTELICYPTNKPESKYVIPDGVKSFVCDTHLNYKNLTEIIVPPSIENIDVSPCESLAKITVDDYNPRYKSIDGVLYDKDMKMLIYYPSGKQETIYVIPNGVKLIQNGAFENCSNLNEIIISDSVEEIAMDFGGNEYGYSSWCSFKNCEGLTKVTVDDFNPRYRSINGILYDKNMTTLIYYPAGREETKYEVLNVAERIGSYAFNGCKNLAEIIVPESVKKINEVAFSGCRKLKVVHIPKNADMDDEFDTYDKSEFEIVRY